MLEIKVAESQEDLRSCFEIRHKVFVEEFAFYDAKNYSNGLEFDEYDGLERSTNLIAFCDGKPAGTVRLIQGIEQPGFGLPFGSLWRVQGLDVGGDAVAQISRAAVLPKFRSSVGNIWGFAYRFLLNAGVKVLFADAYPETTSVQRVMEIQELAKAFGNRCAAVDCVAKHGKRLPDFKSKSPVSRESRKSMPPALRMFFRLGAKLAGDAHWFEEFNGVSFPIVWDFRKFGSKEKSLLARLK